MHEDKTGRIDGYTDRREIEFSPIMYNSKHAKEYVKDEEQILGMSRLLSLPAGLSKSGKRNCAGGGSQARAEDEEGEHVKPF